MVELGQIPVTIEHADGSETQITMAEALSRGLMKGLKVEIKGTGFVKNPEPQEGADT